MKRQLSAAEATSKLKEQRRYLRYVVTGSISLDFDGEHCIGVPVNISMGGILLHTDAKLPTGASGTIQLVVSNFTDIIVSKVRVVRTVATTVAVAFLEEPVELTRLISVLAGESS
jgi:hypothetical protein